MSLQSAHNTNTTRIHDFYKRLTTSINLLDTVGEVKDINGYVRTSLDKLSRIRFDLEIMNDDEKHWKLYELLEASTKRMERNPLKEHSKQQKEHSNAKSSITEEQSYMYLL